MTAQPTLFTVAADLATETSAQLFEGRTHGNGIGVRNTGSRTLEMVSVHPAGEMVTEWVTPR